MSYFIEHGITEEKQRKINLYPDTSGFMSHENIPSLDIRNLEAINIFQQMNHDSTVLQGILHDLQNSKAQKACPPEFIKKIPTVSTASQCPICLEEISFGNILYCKHIFHINCIKPWLQVSNTCPKCRMVQTELHKDDSEEEWDQFYS